MKKAIILNAVFPLLYIILYLMLRYDNIFGGTRVFIAEYASGLLIAQLITCVIGFWMCKKRVIKIILIAILILFIIFLFKTVEGFNPA